MSPITKQQWLKVVKTALWLAGSSVVAYFGTLVTNQPELFGAYLPIANIVGVILKQIFTKESK